MIVTATKFVNARLNKPHTGSANPRFLSPGDKVNVKARAFGETIEGFNEWFLSDENEFFTQFGFQPTSDIADIPFTNVPDLFNKLEIHKLWSISKGETINIGVIDSGVAMHPALKGRVLELNQNVPAASDLNNHGTTMACTIAALDESTNKIGIAPAIKNIFSYIIDVDVVKPSDLITAMDVMLQHKIHILNLSFAINKDIFFPPHPMAVELQLKIDQLTGSGCTIVCATGNDLTKGQFYFPAKYDNVISVAGYDQAGGFDIMSNLWNGVSVCMASDEHYFRDEQFPKSNGTSSATAIISGCIACVYERINSNNKTRKINEIFKNFPVISTPSSSGIISIPKFDTNIFLQSILSLV